MTWGMVRAATVTASTKRPPAISGGKRGDAVTQIASLRCTPLDPADPVWRADVMTRDGRLEALKASAQMLETTVPDGDLDIQTGDTLVVGTKEYPIRACGRWTLPIGLDESYYWRLMVEDVKQR